MDKNQITGLLLIGAIMFGFSYYSSNQAEKAAQEKAIADSIYQANNPSVEQDVLEDVAKVEQVHKQLSQIAGSGDLASALGKNAENYTLENENVKLTISTRGATISAAQLKNYTKYDGGALELMQPESALFDLFLPGGVSLSTSQFTFAGGEQKSVSVSGEDRQALKFKLNVDSTSYVEYIYSLGGDDYMVDLDIRLVGMDDFISPATKELSLKWSNISLQNEKGFTYENQYTTTAYLLEGESSSDELTMSTEAESETIEEPLKWVAFKQQFFSTIMMAREGSFSSADLGYVTMPEGSGQIKHFDASLALPYSAATDSYALSLYFGPNKYSTLKSYDENFEDLVPLGWGVIGWVNRFIVIPTFNFLSQYTTSYGLIILLLTIVIKLIIIPFTYKSYISMAKMRILKPEIDEINAKYPDQKDAMAKQQEVMALYNKAGASPLGGCLPMLFQFPILIAMFSFFPSSIELRGQSFLWAKDLSSYDSILELPFNIPFYGDHISLFAILMGISLFVSSKINFAQTSATSNQQIPGMTFMTLYLMPVMLVVWFNSYASGLCYYYLLSNLITIGQSYGFRKLVDDKKLHEQMKANAKKPRKQNGFQKRYEDMMKQMQEQQKQQQDNK